MLSPLRIKSYRHLFLSQFFSDFGGFLDIIALNILIIYVWGLGPFYTSILLVIFSLPLIFIGPFTAVWVDRLPKKKVMVTCDLLRVCIALCLAGSHNVWLLFGLVFFKVMFGAIFDPARQSMIRYTVPENNLLQATSLSQMLMNLVKIIAPTVGSALMLVTKPSSLFYLEAAGFLISALFVLGLPRINEELKSRNAKEQSFLEELKEGFRCIRSNTLLSFAIFFLGAGMFLIFLYEALFTPWAKSMGFLQSELGFIMTANGLGMAAGAMLLGKWTFWTEKPLYMMIASGITSGLFVTLFGFGSFGLLSLSKFLWVLVFFIIGCTSAGAFVPFGYTLQKETPAPLMGRVSGAANSIINVSMLVGPIIGGLISTWFGAGTVFIGSGFTLTLFAFSMLLYLKKKTRLIPGNEVIEA